MAAGLAIYLPEHDPSGLWTLSAPGRGLKDQEKALHNWWKDCINSQEEEQERRRGAVGCCLPVVTMMALSTPAGCVQSRSSAELVKRLLGRLVYCLTSTYVDLLLRRACFFQVLRQRSIFSSQPT